MLSMHLQCVVCLRNKRNNGCWTRGLLDNQKLLDQITVLVYHLMGSMVPTKTDVSLALALNTFVAVLSKGQRKSLTSVIAIRSGYVIHTIRKVEFLDNKWRFRTVWLRYGLDLSFWTLLIQDSDSDNSWIFVFE